MRALAPAVALTMFLMTSASAELLPQPGYDNPRLQTVRWSPGQEVLLTALPGTGLTVLLERGEQIGRVTLDDEHAFQVRVSPEGDSLMVLPEMAGASGSMLVHTDRRDYRFSLRTDEGLTAAYLVRFEYGAPTPPASEAIAAPTPGAEQASYRLKGDRAVSPASVTDDGVRTFISYGADQALPAVFAIGPTGEEEVVNGYMRDGVYVVDRVFDELVFRIDKSRATARRQTAR